MDKISRSKTFSGTAYPSRYSHCESLVFRRLPLVEQKRLWPVILRERWLSSRSRPTAKRSLSIYNYRENAIDPVRDNITRFLDKRTLFRFPTDTHNTNKLTSCDNVVSDELKHNVGGTFVVKSPKKRAARVELELAIKNNEQSKLLSAIDRKMINLDDFDNRGKTLLHSACSMGNYRCAQILINAGARVDLKDRSGFTPLHCAVVSNHVPCAAVLITSGADIMACTNTMHTALTLAYDAEMVLLIGRALLLKDTLMTSIDQCQYSLESLSLRETSL